MYFTCIPERSPNSQAAIFIMSPLDTHQPAVKYNSQDQGGITTPNSKPLTLNGPKPRSFGDIGPVGMSGSRAQALFRVQRLSPFSLGSE